MSDPAVVKRSNGKANVTSPAVTIPTGPLPASVYGNTASQASNELSARKIVLDDGSDHMCSRVEINQCTPDGFDDGSSAAFENADSSSPYPPSGDDAEDDDDIDAAGPDSAPQRKSRPPAWWEPMAVRPDEHAGYLTGRPRRSKRCAVWRNKECIMRIMSKGANVEDKASPGVPSADGSDSLSGSSSDSTPGSGSGSRLDDSDAESSPASATHAQQSGGAGAGAPRRKKALRSVDEMKAEVKAQEETDQKARQSHVSGPPSRKPSPGRTGGSKGKGAAMSQREMAAEADPCLNQQGCGGCLAQAQCGWCGVDLSEGVCLEGSRSGPSGPDGTKCDFELLGEHGIDITGRLPAEQQAKAAAAAAAAAGGAGSSGAGSAAAINPAAAGGATIGAVADNEISRNLTNKTKAKEAKPQVPMWSYWIPARHPQVEGFPIADSGDVLDACREDAALINGVWTHHRFLLLLCCFDAVCAASILHIVHPAHTTPRYGLAEHSV
jgi:hypothetical protein